MKHNGKEGKRREERDRRGYKKVNLKLIYIDREWREDIGERREIERIYIYVYTSYINNTVQISL